MPARSGSVAVVDVAKPFWQSPDGVTAQLWQGDVLATLRRLPARSVQCVVTSPPYWGLRDYGTGTWEGGDPACLHKIDAASDPTRLQSAEGHAPVAGCPTRDATVRLNSGHRSKSVHKEGFRSPFRGTATGGSAYLEQGKMTAGKVFDRECPLGCGAKCIDAQLGSEARPDCLGWARGENCAERDWATGCHVCRMVLVFREVRRVMRDDAICWINYGDSYASSGGERTVGSSDKGTGRSDAPGPRLTPLPSGNLVGVPWRVALALQADGWVLRQDIIWHKPSPMPESVRNRCTKAHEYVFLLTKRMGYFYDAEAIKEPSKSEPHPPGWATPLADRNDRSQESINESNSRAWGAANSNKRSVWTVASEGFAGAHFATFPKALIRPMILAGTSERGACASCGAPWKRLTEMTDAYKAALASDKYVPGWSATGDAQVARQNKNHHSTLPQKNVTTGWQPTCECHGKLVKRKVKEMRRIVVSANRKQGELQSLVTSGLDSLNRTTVEFGEQEAEKTVEEYVSDLPFDRHPVVPCVVLDPFVGSGTTAVLSVELGRRAWGIDLSTDYLTKYAMPRLHRVCAYRFAETKGAKAINAKLRNKLSRPQKIPKR